MSKDMIIFLKNKVEDFQEAHFDHPDNEMILDAWNNYKDINDFIEQVYEIAFGDDAINKDYTHKEVVDKLKEFSDKSYKYEELTQS